MVSTLIGSAPTPRLYKWLGHEGEAIWGQGYWHLPSEDGQPGEWMPALKGKLELCSHGYHAFEAGDLLDLTPDMDKLPILVEVELPGATKVEGKWLASRGRVLRICARWDVEKFSRAVALARAAYYQILALARAAYAQTTAWAEAAYGQTLVLARAAYAQATAWAEAAYYQGAEALLDGPPPGPMGAA